MSLDDRFTRVCGLDPAEAVDAEVLTALFAAAEQAGVETSDADAD